MIPACVYLAFRYAPRLAYNSSEQLRRTSHYVKTTINVSRETIPLIDVSLCSTNRRAYATFRQSSLDGMTAKPFGTLSRPRPSNRSVTPP